MQISTRLCRQSHVTLLTILIVQKIQLFTPIPWHLNTVFFISCEPFTLISLNSYKNSFFTVNLKCLQCHWEPWKGNFVIEYENSVRKRIKPNFLIIGPCSFKLCLSRSEYLIVIEHNPFNEELLLFYNFLAVWRGTSIDKMKVICLKFLRWGFF